MLQGSEGSITESMITPVRKIRPLTNQDLAWKESVKNVRAYYMSILNIQHLRIQQGNRICGNIRLKLGQKAGTKDIGINKLMKRIKEDYKVLTGQLTITDLNSEFVGYGVITDFTEQFLMDQWTFYMKQEERLILQLAKELKKWPIYTEYLSKIVGVGPLSGACYISFINIWIADTVSKINCYMGIDPHIVGFTPEGLPIKEGRCKKANHLIDAEYIDKNGKVEIKKSITFNDLVKTKIVGVMGPSLFMQVANVVKPGPMDKGYYREVCINKKAQLAERPEIKKGLEIFHKRKKDNEDKEKGIIITLDDRKKKDAKDGAFSPLHVANMANRHMIQIFNGNLYDYWRKLEGLSVREPYAKEKLGIVHSGK